MGRKIFSIPVDDLTNQEVDEVEEIKFSFDGEHYVIELGKENANVMRGTLAPYINAATPVSASKIYANSTAARVREWAIENGYEVGVRGRIPAHIQEAYDHASGG